MINYKTVFLEIVEIQSENLEASELASLQIPSISEINPDNYASLEVIYF